MAPNPNKVFISSSMGELRPERKVVRDTLLDLGMEPFAFEKDAPASPLPAREVWEIDLKESDVCLVMLYKKLGKYTLDEIKLAQVCEIPILMYIKVGDPHPDDEVAESTVMTDEVRAYMNSVDHVDTGLTPKRFEQADELEHEITQSFSHLKRYATHRLKKKAIDDKEEFHGDARVGDETAHGTKAREAPAVGVTPRPVELRNKVDRFSSSFFGRTKERRRALKLVEKQAFTPIVGSDEIGRKSIVQKMAHEEFKDAFPDGAGITPLTVGPSVADVPSAQADLPSLAPDADVGDILQSIWEAVYDADSPTVNEDQRRLDLKRLHALVALTDVELDEAKIQQLVNALENSKIVATMPEGHAPVGRPLSVEPMSDAASLAAMVAEETEVDVDPALHDLLVAKFAATEGLPAKVGVLIAEAFDEVDDAETLAVWLAADGS